MKKRLLITSIVMMLVVAVALSTATYAWFTSNATVSASSMTLRASTSDASSLSIGWTGTVAGTSITSDVFGTLSPMAPESLTPNTTTSAVVFNTSTTYMDQSVIKFNDDGSAVNPVTYHNDGNTISSFYVKNDSPANTVGGVKVKAVFSEYMVALPRTGYTFESGLNYYTYDGSTYSTYAATAEQAYNPGEDGAQIYVYAPYVETKDTVAQKGVDYYSKDTNSYAYSPAVVEVGASVSGLFEKIGEADDMIRVAIFTKVYRQASAYASNKTYYAYNPTTGIFGSVSIANAEAYAAAGQLYVAETDDYLLNVVLAKDHTTGSSAATSSYDLNEVYFTESNGVYSQDTEVTAGNWDSKKATLYTCTYTAVCGEINATDTVKGLTYYTGVLNEKVLATNLQPGEQIEIVAKAWLDGTLLNDKRASQIGTVSLLFSAVA